MALNRCGRQMKHTPIFGVIAMATIVVISNILVQKLLGQWLTWGALTYPFAFLVTDLTNRFSCVAAARRVVCVGFLIGVLCSLIGTQFVGEYGPLVTVRVALGSGIAFLTAQMVDVTIFDRLRARIWWQPPIISSVAGSVIDTALFFTIAFSQSLVWIEPGNDITWAVEILPLFGFGPEAPLWVSLAVADFAVKVGILIIALIPFRLLVRKYQVKT